jgi:hypothetical protein
LTETAAIDTVLDQLQGLADDDRNRVGKSALKALVKTGTIDDCFELLRSVQKTILRCEQVEGQEVRNLGKSIIWPFKEKETKDTLMKLSRMKQNFTMALSADVVYVLSLTCSLNPDLLTRLV